jgi:hypothetical protein
MNRIAASVTPACPTASAAIHGERVDSAGRLPPALMNADRKTARCHAGRSESHSNGWPGQLWTFLPTGQPRAVQQGVQLDRVAHHDVLNAAAWLAAGGCAALR